MDELKRFEEEEVMIHVPWKLHFIINVAAVLCGWMQYTLSFSRVEEQGQRSKAGGWILEQKDYVGWICDTHHAFWEDKWCLWLNAFWEEVCWLVCAWIQYTGSTGDMENTKTINVIIIQRHCFIWQLVSLFTQSI